MPKGELSRPSNKAIKRMMKMPGMREMAVKMDHLAEQTRHTGDRLQRQAMEAEMKRKGKR